VIALRFEVEAPEIDPKALKADARKVLRGVGRARSELSILIVDDPAMRVLNRDFRGIDRTTDVLSFSQVEDEEGPPLEGVPDALGDLVISAPTARRNAGRYKRTLSQELRRLLVHGVLHLLGHDHQKPGEARVMRAEERRVMALLRDADAQG
jgi:probable rRNA maturation factor